MDTIVPPPAGRAAIRKSTGLSQTAAGKLIGVSRAEIARWEAEGGTDAPTVHQWRYFLHVLGLERLPFRAAKR